MERSFTLSEMSEILSRADEPLTIHDRKAVLRQLQNFATKGLLQAAGTRLGDERQTATFTVKSLFLARLLFIFARGGRDATAMRSLVRASDDHTQSGREVGGAFLSEGDLVEAVRDMKVNGTDWTLNIRNLVSPLPAFNGLRVSIQPAGSEPIESAAPEVYSVLSTESLWLNRNFANLLAFVDA